MGRIRLHLPPTDSTSYLSERQTNDGKGRPIGDSSSSLLHERHSSRYFIQARSRMNLLVNCLLSEPDTAPGKESRVVVFFLLRAESIIRRRISLTSERFSQESESTCRRTLFSPDSFADFRPQNRKSPQRKSLAERFNHSSLVTSGFTSFTRTGREDRSAGRAKFRLHYHR